MPASPEAKSEVVEWFVQGGGPDEATFCTGYFTEELHGHIAALHARAVEVWEGREDARRHVMAAKFLAARAYDS